MDEIQDWKQKVKLAPDEELTALRETDYLGLRNTPDPKWSAYINIVEEEIQRRGLADSALTDHTSETQVSGVV